MTREIKFRAWNREAGKMSAVTQLYMPKDDRIQINTSKGWLDGSAPLMQFTGLKDSGGNDIYEGDILEFRAKDIDGTKIHDAERN